jgi:PAS domain-containing protein
MKYVPCILSLMILVGGAIMTTSLREKVIENTVTIQTTNVLLGRLIERTESLEKQQHKIARLFVPHSHGKVLLSGIIRTDLSGVIQDVSGGIEAFLDKDEDELIGTNVSAFMTPSAWDHYSSHLNETTKPHESNSVIQDNTVFMGQNTEINVSHLPSKKMLIINVKEI